MRGPGGAGWGRHDSRRWEGYEQVLECIDLDALYRLEESITMMVGEIDGISDDHICPPC